MVSGRISLRYFSFLCMVLFQPDAPWSFPKRLNKPHRTNLLVKEPRTPVGSREKIPEPEKFPKIPRSVRKPMEPNLWML